MEKNPPKTTKEQGFEFIPLWQRNENKEKDVAPAIKQGKGGQKLLNKKAGKRDTDMVWGQRLTGSWRGAEVGRAVEERWTAGTGLQGEGTRNKSTETKGAQIAWRTA